MWVWGRGFSRVCFPMRKDGPRDAALDGIRPSSLRSDLGGLAMLLRDFPMEDGRFGFGMCWSRGLRVVTRVP